MKKLCLIFVIFGSLFAGAYAAERAGRPSAAPAGARAPIAAGGMGRGMASAAPAISAAAVVTPEPEPEEDIEEEDEYIPAAAPVSAPEPEEPIDEYEGIENRSSEFAARFGGEAKSGGSADETPLKRSIREQKERMGILAKAGEKEENLKIQQAKAGVDTAVACDKDLRNCMAKKCGGMQFLKCATDGDTDWSGKIDSCRRDTKCTGEEYAALSAEIKADRDNNRILSGFDEVIRCGRSYNACVRDVCGDKGYTNCVNRNGTPSACKNFVTAYEKCWAKAGGDRAISTCESEYKKCQMADSGLQARAMDMFAGLRVQLEKNILKWEKSLYDLRDSMAGMCRISQGMFDERSLRCVYTVELFADNDGKSTQFASRKLHGDETYTCNPDEFGIDITTFKENAYRLTRSQTAASSAMLGAGVGVGVGALTSGAIGRAVDSKKAADAAKKAEDNQAGAPGETAQPSATNNKTDSEEGGAEPAETGQKEDSAPPPPENNKTDDDNSGNAPKGT